MSDSSESKIPWVAGVGFSIKIGNPQLSDQYILDLTNTSTGTGDTNPSSIIFAPYLPDGTCYNGFHGPVRLALWGSSSGSLRNISVPFYMVSVSPLEIQLSNPTQNIGKVTQDDYYYFTVNVWWKTNVNAFSIALSGASSGTTVVGNYTTVKGDEKPVDMIVNTADYTIE